jgi:hypothetical protein
MRALHSVTEFSTEQGPAYIEAPKTNTFSLHHPFLVFFQNREKRPHPKQQQWPVHSYHLDYNIPFVYRDPC